MLLGHRLVARQLPEGGDSGVVHPAPEERKVAFRADGGELEGARGGDGGAPVLDAAEQVVSGPGDGDGLPAGEGLGVAEGRRGGCGCGGERDRRGRRDRRGGGDPRGGGDRRGGSERGRRINGVGATVRIRRSSRGAGAGRDGGSGRRRALRLGPRVLTPRWLFRASYRIFLAARCPFLASYCTIPAARSLFAARRLFRGEERDEFVGQPQFQRVLAVGG
ncbi:hypothetical protein SAV31267_071010 [Streptomyces avermitilis]|uniref:Uncharacterized protein n=1 Tax=Streptomyces avermitilis TaxID=33903 RepID=A0A4D4N117_STRAX|nr:hypothetical protein SAV31267_071010 [Streptomyces avermitilis]